MRTPLLSVAASIVVAVTAAACVTDPHARTDAPRVEPTVTIPPETKLLAPPASEPRELPGVDTSALDERERGLFWRWASQLYAPCPDVPVSVAACVEEGRACAACVPAARFLAGRARAGDAQNEAIVAFTVRFGPDVKKVDLADSPSRGPADAPVTVVVWSDFECPACGWAVPILDDMIEGHASEVRLVHKLYPLRSHTHSRAAARAALAAKKQGKYWEMEKKLFSHQKALEDADLEKYAKEIGLDMRKFRRDFADAKADEVIDRDRAEADKHGLSGTPFILINGREFDLSIFKLDRDMEEWISTEVEIRKREAEQRAVAAVGAALTGEGRGPVGPLNTGVPAGSSTAVPAGSSTAVPAAPSTAAPAAPSTAVPAPSNTAVPAAPSTAVPVAPAAPPAAGAPKK